MVSNYLITRYPIAVNRQEKANAGNVTQKIHPPLKLSNFPVASNLSLGINQTRSS